MVKGTESYSVPYFFVSLDIPVVMHSFSTRTIPGRAIFYQYMQYII